MTASHPEPRRCFDYACRVHADCPLYARRLDRQQGQGAMTWRHGWEHPDGPCAVALVEWESSQIPEEGAPC